MSSTITKSLTFVTLMMSKKIPNIKVINKLIKTLDHTKTLIFQNTHQGETNHIMHDLPHIRSNYTMLKLQWTKI